MTHPRVRTICRLAAAWALAAALVSCSRGPAPPAEADVVAATVNGDPITIKDLKRQIARIRGAAPAAASPGGSAEEVSRALRDLVELALVLREGERLGVAVSDSEVEEEMGRHRADFPPGGLEKALLQEGIDMGEWREGLRRSILYRNSVEAIAGRFEEVPERDVQRRFEETYGSAARPERIRVRQFLFDSLEEALEARKKLLAGASPGDVAKASPAGMAGPLDVDLGDLARDELPRGVGEELFSLPEGGVSRVVPLDKTYALFLVVRRTPGGPIPYAEKAPELRRELRGLRREAAIRSWLEEARKKAEVRVRREIVSKLAEGRP